MRVCVYVDGFNLYYRALRKSPHKWLNLFELAKGLLDPADTIETVRYFTARVSPRAGDPEAPRRQQLYLSALQTLPQISIHYGRFLPKTKWRPIVHPTWSPHVFVEVHDTEEKGSDVSFAAHLLNDAWRKRFELALIMSQDTDLCEPIRMVAQDLGLMVGLVCLDGRQPNRRLSRLATFVRHITPARLAAAQFPNPLMGRNGHYIHKPATW
jgi:hypothetical protein